MTSLLLLPGMDGTSQLFEPLLAEWEGPAELRPVRYDIGEAPYPRRPVALPDGPCIVLGESYSGPIAMHLAGDERVVGLVLCCTFATPPVPWGLRAFLSAAVAGPIWSPPAPAVRGLMVGLDADDALVHAVQAAVAEVPPATFRRRIRDVLTVDARRALAQTNCPVLVLDATHDRLVPARCTDELLALRPDAQHVRLEGPHLLLQARPREASEALARFVRSVVGSA